MPSSSLGSHGHKCACGGDIESTDTRDNSRSPSPSHSQTQPRRHGKEECKDCAKRRRRGCSPLLTIFCILNIILIILGTSLALAAFYTSTLGNPNIEDLRTYEYEYHLKRLMHGIGVGGIIAAITGVFGLVAINPKVGTSSLRAGYRVMLLLSAAILLVLGALALGAILIRKNVVENYFRPIMTSYKHDHPQPNPFLTLHRFQAEFRCCGLSKPPDPYQHLKGTEEGPLPWSCCASFDSSVLKDPVKVQQIVDEAQRRECARGATKTHATYCDQINPELADWAFGSAIEAMGVSVYCLILLVISCIAERMNKSRRDESDV